MSTNENGEYVNRIKNARVRQVTNRVHTKDTPAILNEFHKNRGTEDAYNDYLKKYEASVTKQYEAPIELSLALTNKCNLQCKMCFRNYYAPGSMVNFSEELLDSILTEAKELKIPSIKFTGGEPTLHPHIVNIVKKVGMAGFLEFCLITNGTQLNNELLLETIIDVPMTCVSVSLDAATPETYKKIRGGDLNIVERNIEMFLKLRSKKNSQLPLFRVTFINMPANHHELELFSKKWKSIADIVDIQMFTDWNPDRGFTGSDGRFVCDQPFKRIFISPDGELKPCFLAQYHVSDPIYLGKDYNTLMDYWNSDWHLAFCNNIGKKDIKACARCRESYIDYGTNQSLSKNVDTL